MMNHWAGGVCPLPRSFMKDMMYPALTTVPETPCVNTSALIPRRLTLT